MKKVKVKTTPPGVHRLVEVSRKTTYNASHLLNVLHALMFALKFRFFTDTLISKPLWHILSRYTSFTRNLNVLQLHFIHFQFLSSELWTLSLTKSDGTKGINNNGIYH